MKRPGISLALILCGTYGVCACGVRAQSMMEGMHGYSISDPLFTIGETINGYTPPGLLDGLGAYEFDENTVRVLANHELHHDDGYGYSVNDGSGGTYNLAGARISYFDIDRLTKQVVDSGLAYHTIYVANGVVATSRDFLPNNYKGIARLCSSAFFASGEFDALQDDIYVAGEEVGGPSDAVGGAMWALDPHAGFLWHCPDLGRGAWENATFLETGSDESIAVALADDTPPFDSDGDGQKEAAPMYLYIGTPNPQGDYLGRNGLRGGTLYVWVADNGELTPEDFNSSGVIPGHWAPIDNSPTGTPDEYGATGYDEYGYPTQRTLWAQAEALGAFGFSRPEDIATNPHDGSQFVMASTGRDTDFNGADRVGTIYVFETNFEDLSCTMRILYDGDADPIQQLRSPDNLDWSDDGYIYVQEDRAVSGLFGGGAVNPHEAGIIRLESDDGTALRVANIDRNVVLDASIPDPTDAVDVVAGDVGAWESSGIIDVSYLFDESPGALHIVNVMAHGIEDQNVFNRSSRIRETDIVQGGQLLLMTQVGTCTGDTNLDAAVDITDLTVVLAAWGACGICQADINGDGNVGVQDLLILLGAWGDC